VIHKNKNKESFATVLSHMRHRQVCAFLLPLPLVTYQLVTVHINVILQNQYSWRQKAHAFLVQVSLDDSHILVFYPEFVFRRIGQIVYIYSSGEVQWLLGMPSMLQQMLEQNIHVITEAKILHSLMTHYELSYSVDTNPLQP
jgi:hypothetical protein